MCVFDYNSQSPVEIRDISQERGVVIAVYVGVFLLYYRKLYEIMSGIESNLICNFLTMDVKSHLIWGYSFRRGCCDSNFCAIFSNFCSLSEELRNILRRKLIFRCNVIDRGLYKIFEKIGLKASYQI